MPAEPACGEKLARHWCASCHIVANDQKGGADSAPPFATIARKPGFDGGKIAQFLMDPHPKMPDMQLSRDEAKDMALISRAWRNRTVASCRIGYRGIQRLGRALHSLLYLHSRGPRPLYCAPITQWRNWTKRVQWRGPYFRSDEILCVRSADPLIVHNFEAESLVLFQAGHFCAFDGTYIDQHINATVVGLDETIALRDIEPSYGSSGHSASSYE